MKSKVLTTVTLLLILALCISGQLALANGEITSTAIAVQNLGTSDASVTVEFRSSSGTVTNVLTQTIAAGANYNFDQRQASGDPGTDPFSGSAIVASNQPIGAVANIMRTGGTFPSYESYNGVMEAAGSFALPQLLKNVTSGGVVWNTTIEIQNTDTANAADVNVVFIPDPVINPLIGGTLTQPFTKAISIAAGGVYRMNQATEPTGAEIGNNFFGSGRVQTAGSVAVLVVSDGGGQMLLAYPSYTAGTTNPIGLPSMYKNIMSVGDSYSTAALVANMGSSEAQIQIQYFPASGAYTVSGTDTFTIPVNGSKNIDQRSNAPSITSGTFMGGAVITSTNGVPIAVNVNLRGGSRYGMTYGGLMESGTTIYVPIAYKTISSAGFSWSSTIIVYNFGASDATVNFTFYPTAGGSIVDPANYTVSRVQQFDLRFTTAVSSTTSFIGSVKITSSQNVGAMVQTRGIGGTGDALMAFQGMMP